MKTTMNNAAAAAATRRSTLSLSLETAQYAAVCIQRVDEEL